jgi:hypothetical protein
MRINWIIHQQVLGYEAQEKLYRGGGGGVCDQRKLNTTDLDYIALNALMIDEMERAWNERLIMVESRYLPGAIEDSNENQQSR